MWQREQPQQLVEVAAPNCPAEKKIEEYFAANFYLTTAAVDRNVIDTMLEIGVDRLLFSTDWPFEDIGDTAV